MCERLPTERIFLIRLSSNAEPASGTYCGRVEHVPTGRVMRFSTLSEIEQFMSDMLKGVEKDD